MSNTKKFTIAKLAVGKVQTEDQARTEALEGEVAKVASLLSDHIEKFACAFAEEVGLDPTKIKMVKQLTDGGVGFKLWFEPFPDESDIETYRVRAERAEADNTKLRGMIDRLIEAGRVVAEYTNENTYCWESEINKAVEDWRALGIEWKKVRDEFKRFRDVKTKNTEYL